MSRTKRTIRFLLVGLLAVIFSGALPHGLADARSLPANPGNAYDLIAAVNALRTANGLPAYKINNSLMSAAQGHSDYQASTGSITHSGSGGSSAKGRAIAAGYGGGATVFVSENIAGGSNMTTQGAVSMWQGDDLHLNTMLGASYTDVGAGVATDGKVVYFTLDVGYVAGNPGSGSSTSSTSVPGAPAATAVAFPVLEQATPQADGSIVHTVQSGQTLWTISAIYEVPLETLEKLNNQVTGAWIHPGDKILVALPREEPTPTRPTPTERPTPTRPPTSTARPSKHANPCRRPTTGSHPPAQEQPPSADRFVPFLIGALVLGGTILLFAGNLLKRRT